MTIRSAPTYNPQACSGCSFATSCKSRGQAKVFTIKEVRGSPVYCKQIDGMMVACRAEHLPDLEESTPLQRTLPTYLVDANVFISDRHACRQVVEHAGENYRLATTRPVYRELKYGFRLPRDLEIVDVDLTRLDARLVRIAEANEDVRMQDETWEEPSLEDLSLVQALLVNARFKGILSEDNKLRRIHPPSFIRKTVGRETEFLNCGDFLRSKPNLFRSVAR